MPEWYQSSLPEHLRWHGSPSSTMFWRSAVIAESKKSDQAAFTGRNLMRLFQALHTQIGVGLDLIMVLVDVPRERVLFAAFPSFLGVTTGSGFPMLTADQMAATRRGESVPSHEVAVVGGDENERKEAAAAEQRIAGENEVRQLGIVGPDGEKWSVYIQEFSVRPSELLEADGHTLTIYGAQRVERFVHGVLMAAREWVLVEVEGGRGVVEVSVQRVSPLTGPSLRESLGNSVETPQPETESAKRGSTNPNQPYVEPQFAGVKSSAKTRVEVRGSHEGDFAVNPSVKVFWNGTQIGVVEHFGVFSFELERAGELTFKSGIRSRRVNLNPGLPLRIQLEWDRTWGRLLAHVVRATAP